MSVKSKPVGTNCIIGEHGLFLNGEQDQRRTYYEEIFSDVLEITRQYDNVMLDLTELERRERGEVFLIGASAKLRRKLRLAFGHAAVERAVVRKGAESLCRLVGFS